MVFPLEYNILFSNFKELLLSKLIDDILFWSLIKLDLVITGDELLA